MKYTKTSKYCFIGGHLTPALSVAEVFLSHGYKNLIWIGTQKTQTAAENFSAEYSVVKELGLTFINLQAGKLWRKWTPATFLLGLYNLILIPLGFINAFFILLKYKPDAVISFGGYLAVPVVAAAKILNVPTFTHEQTPTVGLANARLMRMANRVFVSWPESLEHLSAEIKKKTVLTGNPVRPSLLKVTTDKYKFAVDLPLIYVTGGNQGANTINKRLYPILPRLLKQAVVIHQVGNSSLTGDLETAAKTAKELPAELRSRYVFFANQYGPELGEIFHKASVVVARAGANTVTDLLTLGKMAVLIPIPWSGNNEQEINAGLLASTGLGLVLKQYDAMPPEELEQAIIKALDTFKSGKAFDGRPLAEAVQAAQQKVQPDAALKIFQEITG